MYNLGYETVLNFNFFSSLSLSFLLPSHPILCGIFRIFNPHYLCQRNWLMLLLLFRIHILASYFHSFSHKTPSPTSMPHSLPFTLLSWLLAVLYCILYWPCQGETNQCRNDREALARRGQQYRENAGNNEVRKVKMMM